MKVSKFGGSILKDSQDIKNITKVIESDIKNNDYCIYIFSAFYGVTDKLFSLINDIGNFSKNKSLLQEVKLFHVNICKELDIDIEFLLKIFDEIQMKMEFFSSKLEVSPKNQAVIVSYGEVISSLIIYKYTSKNLRVSYIDSSDLIKTDSVYLSGNVDFKLTYSLIKNTITKDNFYICAGFISSNKSGEMTVLGRNGSDYSSAIFGEAVKASKVYIWKDVSGVFTADPKVVRGAERIRNISYREMSELCYFGAKVIHLNALRPLLNSSIPIEIRSLYESSDHKGTIISGMHSAQSVIGIASMPVTIISIAGIESYHKKSAFRNDIINRLSANKIEVFGSFQFSSVLSFTIITQQTHTAIIEKLLQDIVNPSLEVTFEQNSSIIAVIGENMLKASGVMAKIFNALSSKNISVDSCVSGFNDINICFSIPTGMRDEALNIIHDSVFSS